jgi:hypothetical protein
MPPGRASSSEAGVRISSARAIQRTSARAPGAGAAKLTVTTSSMIAMPSRTCCAAMLPAIRTPRPASPATCRRRASSRAASPMWPGSTAPTPWPIQCEATMWRKGTPARPPAESPTRHDAALASRPVA